MGCFGCFEPRSVEDEPKGQAQSHQKASEDDQRPSTAPAAPAFGFKRALGSPVPSASSQESNATRDPSAPLLRTKGSPQPARGGTSPLTRTGSGPTSKNGRRNGGGTVGFAQLQENGAQEDHASLGSQDSLKGQQGAGPWNHHHHQQQQQQQQQQQGQGLGQGQGQGTAVLQESQHPSVSLNQRGDGSQRAGGYAGSDDGSVGKGRSASAAAAVAAAFHSAMGDAAQEKALQPHEPLPQPSTLGPIRDPIGAPIAATTFTFKELERATRNFSHHNFVGEGGFGRVYKGKLESTGQIVAVKQLDRNGLQGNREFLVEVLMLSLLHHPNLVQLIGYCADGDQRLLVYEFMAKGALEDHLHDLPENKEPLDWNMRMKVAAGAAKGLEYLHDKANPPVIYRDFKSSNILLDETWHPKLSDFGLAKLGPVGDKTHVSTRVMGTYGYCAPEYAMTGQLTVKSDVYSFGVVLLELITGRKAIDNTRPSGEHNLVAWARPLFKDRRKFPAMADPLLQGRYPMRGLYQALAVAAMCLQEQASQRPMIHDVVTALSYLAAQHYDPNAPQPQRFSPGTPQHELGRDRRGSRSPQVRGMAGASPRASPAHGGHRPRGFDGPGSPGLGPLGATSSARGYRESPGRSGLGSGRSTPNHPLAKTPYGENMKPMPPQVPE